jgi:hypothetical protein
VRTGLLRRPESVDEVVQARSGSEPSNDRNGNDVALREEFSKVLRIGRTTGDGSPSFPVNP